MTGFQHGAFAALVNVKWTGGTWIVVNARRMGKANGNGLPGAPSLDAATQLWHPATAVQPVSLNNPFMRDGFPEQYGPKPGDDGKFPSPVAFKALTSWGANYVDDVNYGGGPQLMRVMEVMDENPGGGYQNGQWVRNLQFWNMNAIKKFPPYGPGPDNQGNLPKDYTPPTNPQDIVWFLQAGQLLGIDQPPQPGPRTIWYVWGQLLEFHPDFPPLKGDPVFNIGAQRDENYYLAPFKIGEKGDPTDPNNDINIAYIDAFIWYYTRNIGQATPSPPVRWPAQPQNQATAEALVTWAEQYGNANPTGNSGTTLEVRSAVIPATPVEPKPQPEAYIEFKVQLYSGAVAFTYTGDNTPTWNKAPEEEYSFTWGGTAPQAGALWEIKFKQKTTGNQKRLEVRRTV